MLCDIMLRYLLSSRSLSFDLASSGMSTSGVDLDKSLESGYSCNLKLCGICGSSLEMLHHRWFQLISWTSSHVPTGCMDAIGIFLPILQGTLLAFRTGMFRYCGVLWSTLCRMSSRITPSWSQAVTTFILYKLVVFFSFRVLRINTDTGGRVILPFVFTIG